MDAREKKALEARVGGTVGGRYTLTSIRGLGHQGVVYVARDEREGRDVALKLLASKVTTREGLARFERESAALQQLNTDGVMPLLDFGSEPDGTPYFVTSLLVGETLAQRLDRVESRGDRLEHDLLIRLAHTIGRVLDHAHALGFVHRDVKPSNVFLERDRGPLLLDFGYVRGLDSNPVTHRGVVLGTIAYIAPECALATDYDGRADLYSLGVIVFRCLSGRLPFVHRNPVRALQLAGREPRPSLHALEPTLPPEIDAFVERALAVKPIHRFQSGVELATALEYCLTEC